VHDDREAARRLSYRVRSRTAEEGGHRRADQDYAEGFRVRKHYISDHMLAFVASEDDPAVDRHLPKLRIGKDGSTDVEP
jgi:hypothetical protein